MADIRDGMNMDEFDRFSSVEHAMCGYTYIRKHVTVIDLHMPTARCCICGETDLSKWGVPIDMETALIVANDFVGDWASKPACESCWKRHESGEFVGHDPGF